MSERLNSGMVVQTRGRGSEKVELRQKQRQRSESKPADRELKLEEARLSAGRYQSSTILQDTREGTWYRVRHLRAASTYRRTKGVAAFQACEKVAKGTGGLRESNPRPLRPERRIIPLDQTPEYGR